MLRLGSADPRAARLCLQAILPALKSQAARLARGPRPREELWELLFANAWEAIRRYPLARERRVAANLVLEVLHGSTRELRRERRGAGLAGGPLTAVGLERARGREAPAAAHPCGAEGLVMVGLQARTRLGGKMRS